MELAERVQELARLRKELQEAEIAAGIAEDAMMQTAEYKVMEAAQLARNEKRQVVKDAEGALRLLAVNTYEAGACDKHPAPGITIKVFTKANYDPAAALAWCKEHAVTFVREVLDTKTFDKVALDLPGAPVEKITYSQANIDSDLSRYFEWPTPEPAPASEPVPTV